MSFSVALFFSHLSLIKHMPFPSLFLMFHSHKLAFVHYTLRSRLLTLSIFQPHQVRHAKSLNGGQIFLLVCAVVSQLIRVDSIQPSAFVVWQMQYDGCVCGLNWWCCCSCGWERNMRFSPSLNRSKKTAASSQLYWDTMMSAASLRSNPRRPHGKRSHVRRLGKCVQFYNKNDVNGWVWTISPGAWSVLEQWPRD